MYITIYKCIKTINLVTWTSHAISYLEGLPIVMASIINNFTVARLRHISLSSSGLPLRSWVRPFNYRIISWFKAIHVHNRLSLIMPFYLVIEVPYFGFNLKWSLPKMTEFLRQARLTRRTVQICVVSFLEGSTFRVAIIRAFVVLMRLLARVTG
jgi:hypothetical protein